VVAARNPNGFVNMTTKAVNQKALRETLAPCSAELKLLLSARRVLKKKNLLKALDLALPPRQGYGP